MFKISRKRLEIALALGLISAILLSVSSFNASCDDLRTNILRLHIIANSDSKEDQALKLKVRDEILEKTGNLFVETKNLSDAKEKAESSLEEFESIANQVILENGYSYTAKARVGNSNFNTREYDDFTLPAGEYPSLIITLGEGNGQNWWCVVYPAVCVPAASKHELKESTKDKSAKIAQNPRRYVMRFKTVEIYEKIKNLLNK